MSPEGGEEAIPLCRLIPSGLGTGTSVDDDLPFVREYA